MLPILARAVKLGAGWVEGIALVVKWIASGVQLQRITASPELAVIERPGSPSAQTQAPARENKGLLAVPGAINPGQMP